MIFFSARLNPGVNVHKKMVDALEEYDRKGIKTGHLPTRGGGD